MEVMDTSLDKFYVKVNKAGRTIAEDILGKIAFGVCFCNNFFAHLKLREKIDKFLVIRW